MNIKVQPRFRGNFSSISAGRLPLTREVEIWNKTNDWYTSIKTDPKMEALLCNTFKFLLFLKKIQKHNVFCLIFFKNFILN